MFTLEEKINIALTYIATDDKNLRKKLKSMAAEAVKDVASSSETPMPQPNVDDLIIGHLKKCGMPPHIKGRPYMITAIKLVLADPAYLDQITCMLYPEIASQHNTTASRAERALRHAVECCFDRGDTDYIHATFGDVIDPRKGKLTNSEFIAGSVDEIKRLMK